MRETTDNNVVPFPVRRVAESRRVELRRASILRRIALRRWLGRWLFRARVPGAIQDIELRDSATGQRLSVWVGEYYVRLCVDGRDYYFDRLTGRFDGMGTAR